MSIGFKKLPYEVMLTSFAKTLVRTPITKTTSNMSNQETLTEGTTVSISGCFYRKEDEWLQDKPILLQNADAVVLVKSNVTLNKDDKLTYDSENYRVDKVVTRRLGTIVFYKVAQLFKI